MTRRIASLVSWIFTPEWLSLQEAAHLSGFDRKFLRSLIDDGGVDAELSHGHWVIEKRSLREYQEALALVLQWAQEIQTG